MSAQFPPSSPLISNDDYAVSDPFAVKSSYSKGQVEERGRTDYPTPNPSSALFRSSSPVLDAEEGDDEIDGEEDLEKTENELRQDIEVIEKSNAKQSTKNSSKSKKSVSFNLQTKVAINKDFNILHPDARVLRIPLVTSKSHITIGRSSKTCDYALNSHDSYISRSHVSVCHNAEHIVLSCIGSNGVAIRIPKPCFVYATSAKNHFVVMENKSGKPLDITNMDLQKTRRSIVLDANHTEFFVRKNETVTLPRFSNVLLEISEQVLLLNPEDIEEELTEDEMPVLIQNEPMATPLKAPLKNFPPRTPVKASTNQALEHNDDTPSKPPVVGSVHASASVAVSSAIVPSTLVSAAEGRSAVPSVLKDEVKISTSPKVKSEKGTPKKVRKHPHIHVQQKSLVHPKPVSSFKIFEEVNKEEPKTPSPSVSPQLFRQSTPLNDKSNTFSNPSTPKTKRALSEEPPKQKKKSKKTLEIEKVEINQEWIKDINNVEEINNILINHLAFSRLSSTPASFLNTISVVASKLELRQIRVLLHNIKCIGVIYREGKDAAGKPLEEEYYYILENDDDAKRTALVANVKGHGGLRSCRRTHKQYYWKKPAPIKK